MPRLKRVFQWVGKDGKESLKSIEKLKKTQFSGKGLEKLATISE